MKLDQLLEEFLHAQDRNGQLRARSIYTQDSRKRRLCFCSNDYLGLAQHPKIREYYRTGYQRFGTGSGASALIAGYQAIHKKLEEDFCVALDCEAGLLFSSGYAANLGLMALLGRLQINALVDKSIHASVYDGLKLANVQYSRYPHRDMEYLEKRISNHCAVVTEGIFSMSGHQSDLKKMAAMTSAHESVLLVDEAHSFGVIGSQGLGMLHQAQLSQEEAPLRMIPFGKSLASMGAIVVGKKQWIDGLLQVARSCIYSTAISPAVAFGVQQSLHFILQAEKQRHHLHSLVAYFRDRRKDSSLHWIPSETAVQRIVTGCHQQAFALQRHLQTLGINTQLIRYPTVSVPETGLRLCLTANHDYQAIDTLFNALALINDHDFAAGTQ